ncbi:MAG: ATP-binding protein [bacterium]
METESKGLALEARPSSGKTQALAAHSSGILRRYAEAVALSLMAVGISWLLRDVLVSTRFIVLWVMSIFVAWRGGLGPVAVASLLGVFLWDIYLTPPYGSFAQLSATEVVQMVFYVVLSLVLGYTDDMLRRERVRVAQATDGMIDAMFVFGARWNLQFYNAAASDMLGRLGIDADSLEDNSLWDTVPALIGTPFERETKRAQAERKVVEYEARYPDAELWLQVRCVPADHGGLSVFAHDVTAAKYAELLRHQTDERYRALVETSTIMVWSPEAQGTVTALPEWKHAPSLVAPTGDHTGAVHLIHPDDLPRVRVTWQLAMEREQPYEVEYRQRGTDDHFRWCRVRAVPVRADDRIAEWVGVFDDIEDEHVGRERHTAVDNALAVLGASLDYEWNLATVTRMLVPTLADYCSVDVVDANGTIQRVASTHVRPEKEEVLRALWAKYPYRYDDPGSPFVVRTGLTLLTPHIAQEAVAAFVQAPEQAAMLEQLSPRSFLCVPMSSHGTVFGALSLVYSESDRVYGAAEQAALEQIAARAATAIENARLFADAQAASRAKSDFLATMSHELRTPLNAIAGYAELLAMGVRGPVTDEQKRDLARIRQNQQHLLEIITDILNFSRMEAGHTRYDLHPMRLADVLERMEGVIEPQARVRDIIYEYQPPADGVTVVADREKLEQVLINLLGNAVKFTPRGGTIALSADATATHVRIHVRDTGVGIAPEQLASIFEPFVQLEPALTRTAEGTGLGLAISRELTRGMKGELRAESTPGQGSVFTVELPRAE